MGYRLHVARVYKVEYALGDAFNYKCEEFHSLLSACDATYTGESWESEFEVTKEDWLKVIDKLKNLNNLEEDERDEIRGSVDDLASTTNEVVSMMEYYLEHGDPDIDYLHLSFF